MTYCTKNKSTRFAEKPIIHRFVKGEFLTTGIVFSFLFSFLVNAPGNLVAAQEPENLQRAQKRPQKPEDFQQKTPFWFQGVGESLKARFDRDRLYFKTDTQRHLHDFYKARNFEPMWLTPSGWSVGTGPITDVLHNAHLEGLNPTKYQPGIQTLQAAKKNVTSLLKAEIEFTASVLDYIKDLGGERINPRKIGKSLYLKPDPVEAVQILVSGMSSDQTGRWLGSLTVHNPQYQALKKLLVTYRKKAQQEQGKSRPTLPKGPLLETGKSHPQVLLLRNSLLAHGDKSLELSSSTSSLFDEVTEAAVKRFQKKSSLEIDGVVGPQTRKALNKTAQDKVNQILVTMERWRWLPETFEDRYLMVNIPAFELRGYEDGRNVLTMPVIIGRQSRETPLLNSSIYSIRFNPSWYVPHSIAVKDKLVEIRNDPSYLAQNGYTLYDKNGTIINPHSVNWSEVTSGSFHYRLRQSPGAKNALGKIRFAIKNPFNVYLHSTPDQHLFDESVRSFSSGCVRVARPADLAYFVLNEPSQWTLRTIAASMEGAKTRNVKVKKPVPVYISYFTVWVDDSGEARFMDDIYGQDAKIIKVLNNLRDHVRPS